MTLVEALVGCARLAGLDAELGSRLLRQRRGSALDDVRVHERAHLPIQRILSQRLSSTFGFLHTQG